MSFQKKTTVTPVILRRGRFARFACVSLALASNLPLFLALSLTFCLLSSSDVSIFQRKQPQRTKIQRYGEQWWEKDNDNIHDNTGNWNIINWLANGCLATYRGAEDQKAQHFPFIDWRSRIYDNLLGTCLCVRQRKRDRERVRKRACVVVVLYAVQEEMY